MTEATTSTPSYGTSVDQVAAVNALLAEEFNPVSEDPPRKDEEGAEDGQPDLSTVLEGDGEGSVEAQAGDEDITWASALGVDENQLHLDDNGNLAGLKVKVDGEESIVPVKELIAGYQTQKHFTKKSQALAEDKRQFETVRDQAASNFLQKLEQADQLVTLMGAQLMDRFKGVDLESLRQSNPAEYVARKDEMAAEQQRLQTIMAALQNERNQIMQAQQAEQQGNLQRFLAYQHERVLDNNPEWHDQDKMVNALKGLYGFANEQYGITDQEFSSLVDARHIEILKDAMAYRKGQALATEKVNNAPKFIKGGKSGKPMDRLTQLTLNARKAQGANKINAQAAAVNELLAGL